MASGPSLTKEVANKIRKARWLDSWRVIAVNDAYKLNPYADILYAADWAWWKAHKGAPEFHGERWTSHSDSYSFCDDKSLVANTYPIHLVEAKDGRTFKESGGIHYGASSHSGFHAVNLAIILGCTHIVLCGFDMRVVNGQSHFFGEHPEGLRRCPDEGYRDMAKSYPKDSRILNATPGSAITAYEFVDLDEALQRHRHLHWHGAESRAAAN